MYAQIINTMLKPKSTFVINNEKDLLNVLYHE
jgi:hypothetical protein